MLRQLDLQGWHSTDPLFEELILEVKPKQIIEVGTWKGASAIHMAGVIKKYKLDCKIKCVDTWLGALEFYTEPTKDRDLQLVEGYPSIYYQFLYNIEATRTADIISAFPNTSDTAFKYFKHIGLKADLIYIDGSHEYEDVYKDIHNYIHLLNPGGIMFGDDYDTAVWPGVVNAYHTACTELEVAPKVKNGFWVIRKDEVCS